MHPREDFVTQITQILEVSVYYPRRGPESRRFPAVPPGRRPDPSTPDHRSDAGLRPQR